MRFAGQDKLHRPLGIGENAQQPVRIVKQQIRPLVGREAARKTQGQRAGVEDRGGFGDLARRGALSATCRE